MVSGEYGYYLLERRGPEIIEVVVDCEIRNEDQMKIEAE
jgi:hypothetical protein